MRNQCWSNARVATRKAIKTIPVASVAGTINFQCEVKAFHAAESDVDDVNGAVIKRWLSVKYLVSIEESTLKSNLKLKSKIPHSVEINLRESGIFEGA